MQRINEEQERDDIDIFSGPEFNLHKFGLRQLQDSYHAYRDCHKSLVYAA